MAEILVGFLGYGRMAQAISAGLDRAGAVPYAAQAATALDPGRLKALAKERGFTALADNPSLLERAPVVVVAVKPHQVKAALAELSPAKLAGRLIVSIAAGVTLANLAAWLPGPANLVRALPNLPALVGQGVALICAPPGADPAHLAKAKAIFDSVGSTVELSEAYFDQGTAVSGSGPAYFFQVMEALVRGAVRLGLTWETAKELVLKTALGSVEMALARPDLALSELR
ncbi:MAG: NAD(P)-binding domain-containing protein, partial [Deltaproteobacteria bacterium]|nr:NAD(P)-binding domain-containing protein [Deltaproteobacteria bacterium]